MEFTVTQLAELLKATIEGDASAVVHTVCKIEESVPGGLTFLANPKYTHFLYETRATAAIVNNNFNPEQPVTCTLIRVENAYLAFAKLLDFYNQMKRKNQKSGISPLACLSSTAKIGQNVYIGEFVSVGDNVVIGDNVRLDPHVCLGNDVMVGHDTILHSGVKIYAECVVGACCILHAGAVIGADGFGFAQQEDDFTKVPQIGNVVIEDHVEIGANTCIDRATMGSTRIGKNVKIDNLVQIAHNVEVGEGSAFASQVGIAGSAKVGKHCIFGGQVGVAGHITVGDRVMLGAQSGVSNSLAGGRVYLGSPAIPFMEEKKLIIYRKKLAQLYKQVAELEKKLNL
ncbi:MAG: UDP-3-O-(3-hydroxymyristoyl)glucosamine N-acyltransferase [Bacteroidales bacterium]|jgi:UDP-3-O-[3-hydroxymyristoyl] glucosamine N-acyltransferase|nr:UDP-3-O-(3-hydroxymyristoyl)glucosamine N-acyltransferase [Bacteroidales bacterium]